MRYIVIAYQFCEKGFEIIGSFDTQERAKSRARNLHRAFSTVPIAVIDTERSRVLLEKGELPA